MSNVVRTDIDALNAILTVTLTKEDYLKKVNNDIKRYSQRMQRPGFRPGKTPASLVKKLYGDSFVIEAVQETVQKRLGEYLEETKPDIFGQPLMSEEQSQINFDPKNPKDLTFVFNIGLIPEFDIQGLDGVAYERYAVSIGEDKIDAEVENMRKRGGEEIDAEGNIEDDDMVTLHVKEQGGSLEKEALLVSTNWLTPEMKDVFKTKKCGDTFSFNIFQLEKETTPQYVRKYFLGLEDKDDREINENFDATIKFVKRKVLSELNQAFFDENFGQGVVSNETEMRQLIRLKLSKTFEAQADALLLRDIQDGLIKVNQFDLPDVFMKRWLRTQNEKNTLETIEAGYPQFAQNLRWTLVRSKIAKSANIQIDDEDLKEQYRNHMRGYFGGQALPGGNEAFIESLVERVMADEKQLSDLYEEVLTDKTFDAMKSRIQIVSKPISEEEFNSIISAAQYEAAKMRGEIKEEEEDTTSAEIEEVEAEEVA